MESVEFDVRCLTHKLLTLIFISYYSFAEVNTARIKYTVNCRYCSVFFVLSSVELFLKCLETVTSCKYEDIEMVFDLELGPFCL